MYTNKTGAPLCADKDGNIVPCDSPEAATVAVGAGSQISAEDAKQYKGLPKGDENVPAEAEDTAPAEAAEAAEDKATPKPDTDPAEQPAPPAGGKAVEAAPANKMELGKATKEDKK